MRLDKDGTFRSGRTEQPEEFCEKFVCFSSEYNNF